VTSGGNLALQRFPQGAGLINGLQHEQLATGCANQGLDINADLAAHGIRGPANQDANGITTSWTSRTARAGPYRSLGRLYVVQGVIRVSGLYVVCGLYRAQGYTWAEGLHVGAGIYLGARLHLGPMLYLGRICRGGLTSVGQAGTSPASIVNWFQTIVTACRAHLRPRFCVVGIYRARGGI